MVLKIVCGVVLLIWLASGVVLVGRMMHEVWLVQGSISRKWVMWAYVYAVAGVMVASLCKWII